MKNALLIAATLFLACFPGITDQDGSSESDKNNSISTAVPISLGETINLRIWPRSDTDYYKLELTQGALLHLESQGAPSNIDLYVEIQDREKTMLAYNTDFAKGKQCDFWYSAKPGTYWIMLKDGYDNDSSATNFTFRVTADTVDTFEYNQDLKWAAPISLDSIYYARLHNNNDVDFYEFILLSNKILRCRVDSISNRLNPALQFFDFEGTPLRAFPLLNINSSRIDTGYSLKAGTYYVSVSHSYSLYRPGNSLLPYLLQIAEYLGDSCEWNNDTAHATPTAMGLAIEGNIWPKDDIDCFRFTCTSDTTITVSIDSISSKIRMVLAIHDHEDTKLKENTGRFGETIKYSASLKAGQYFLKLSSSYDSQPSERLYQLRLE